MSEQWTDKQIAAICNKKLPDKFSCNVAEQLLLQMREELTASHDANSIRHNQEYAALLAEHAIVIEERDKAEGEFSEARTIQKEMLAEIDAQTADHDALLAWAKQVYKYLSTVTEKKPTNPGWQMLDEAPPEVMEMVAVGNTPVRITAEERRLMASDPAEYSPD